MTISELDGLTDLLTREAGIIDICKEGARDSADLALKELYEDMAQRHREHYLELLKELQE